MSQSNLKWYIAISLIVLLSLSLVFVLVGKPKFEEYVYNKQVEAQKILIDAEIKYVDANGYVVLGREDNSTLILVKYIPNENEQ